MAKKADYGNGHPNFLKYANYIVNHENYRGMPDVYKDDKSIQWEAPSNRASGKFKDSHIKRRSWWQKKAESVGIDTSKNKWISKTAKTIHPTMSKPCKRCGRTMDLRYSYPTQNLIKRLKKLSYIREDFEFNSLEHILELTKRLHSIYGDAIFKDFPKLFKCKSVNKIPEIEGKLDLWISWINEEYIPNEPSMLSPGAMANPPDRLDGFHTLNECCRSTSDKGRAKENMSSYSTDRRAFEYWVDGDWIAADKLMGIIRSNPEIKKINCLYDNHPGPCAADHIGPISLGFKHRPTFQLLCGNCNSAKNNRMTLLDVKNLIATEKVKGEDVASWYALPLWNSRKFDVNNNETALRLSKMLRDNRHTAMFVLNNLFQKGHILFLCTFLGLDYANRSVDIIDLKTEHNIVTGTLQISERFDKYVTEQKARRIRVGFDALNSYVKKENRNALLINNDYILGKLNQIDLILSTNVDDETRAIQKKLIHILAQNEINDIQLSPFLDYISLKEKEPTSYIHAKKLLMEIMILVGQEISNMWYDERYVREINNLELSLD
ncbi:Alw26I/Eco31I/Esp3I family type II restriction endonuclease [Bacillus paranthracis]|uniref:Alw26I/Eco31I/Esp3I family type II restriction endonuclease n=1 Tax=Bacillus paranthracis TaxID=2026186 RepID=UPI0021583B4E|nr:Alw26I/Eco31I/Esp3I family type II restriction endonuclease [Bacillus paranthracis]MCR6790482.1 Alw26I/Eco31I/Esp3I family type II restriction endonuclease [Bacillus paranthracis]MED1164911.1 Alw26I/Eco31I/Esp3I family type II restriction endonuclease [Bacillus paranthracis]